MAVRVYLPTNLWPTVNSIDTLKLYKFVILTFFCEDGIYMILGRTNHHKMQNGALISHANLDWLAKNSTSMF